MPIAAGLADRIDSVTYDSLPDDAQHWARVAILDTVGVTLAGRALACSQPREMEQRMPVEKFDEMLAHHAGGAEDADFDSAHRFHLTL